MADAKKEHKKERKDALFLKFAQAFEQYVHGTVCVININSAGSFQLQKFRAGLREKGILIMGKNTLIRKVLRERASTYSKYQELVPFLIGTIGLVFTFESVAFIQKLLKRHTFTTLPPKLGSIAPNDIIVPACFTGLPPNRTRYFSLLNIATKISKGETEIITNVKICNKGEKVGEIVAIMCESLNLKPFSRMASIEAVYDRGYVFAYNNYILPSLKESNFLMMFLNSVFRFAALSAALGIVNEATTPYYSRRLCNTQNEESVTEAGDSLCSASHLD